MKKVSRREFIENALRSAAAAAAATAAPETALAWRPSAGPNERLRVAVIGVRGRGDAHLGAFLKFPDVEVASICDVDQNVIGGAIDKVQKATGKKPAYYPDARKLFEDKSIDAVSIATCNHTHTLLAVWALQAGKHAYVEKPMSHNVWEGRKLVQAAKKYDKAVIPGTQSRSMTGMRAAMEFLHSGKLGKVKLARGFCYKRRGSIGKTPESPVPPGVDYDLWLGPAPVRPFSKNRFHYNWHYHWDYGNGDLGNTGVHQMEVARWGIQKSELPRSAVSLGGRLGYEDDGETANTQIVVNDYGDVQIIFEVRGLPTEKYERLKGKMAGVLIGNVFECAEGALVFTNYASGIAYTWDGQEIQKFGGGSDNDHFRSFVDAVKNNKPESLNATALDGHVSSSLCHLGNISYRLGSPRPFSTEDPFGKSDAANEAYRRFRDHLKESGVKLEGSNFILGRPLEIDPKSESLRHDPEASRLLTREYRKPFVVPEDP